MALNDPLVAVTGATGAIGGRVARALADRGRRQRLVVRDPDRAPRLPGAEVATAAGYHDREGMAAALRGVDTLLLVSAREAPDRVALHRSAVDAAVDAGVRRIVYLSFLGAAPDATFTFARDHHHTEQHIRAAGLAFTFLRDSLYLDFLPGFAGADGVIAAPAGDGRVAAVARDDAAAVAVAALTQDGHDGRAYDVTGAERSTLREVAEQLTRFAGRTVTYRPETVEEAYASRAVYQAPRFEVDGWVSSYLAIARGELDVVADTVQRLTGRKPQTLPDYLAAHPESYAHLRQG